MNNPNQGQRDLRGWPHLPSSFPKESRGHRGFLHLRLADCELLSPLAEGEEGGQHRQLQLPERASSSATQVQAILTSQGSLQEANIWGTSPCTGIPSPREADLQDFEEKANLQSCLAKRPDQAELRDSSRASLIREAEALKAGELPNIELQFPALWLFPIWLAELVLCCQ